MAAAKGFVEWWVRKSSFNRGRRASQVPADVDATVESFVVNVTTKPGKHSRVAR
jgi:hypothetical protein